MKRTKFGTGRRVFWDWPIGYTRPTTAVKKATPPKSKATSKTAPHRSSSTASPSKQLASFTAVIRQSNKAVSSAVAQQIAYAIIKKSPRYGLDPRLVLSLVRNESAPLPRCRLQIIPLTVSYLA